jgi:hypothetical protein
MKLWIDDIRDPAEWRPNEHWLWVKNYKDAINALVNHGISHVSFDHDLGEDLTGYDIAKEIEAAAANGTMKRITWEIHSANPVGAANIKLAMESADKFWSLNEG